MTAKPKGAGVSEKMACEKMYQNVEKHVMPHSDVGNLYEAPMCSTSNQVRLLYEVLICVIIMNVHIVKHKHFLQWGAQSSLACVEEEGDVFDTAGYYVPTMVSRYNRMIYNQCCHTQ